MTMLAIRFRIEPLRTLAFGAISGVYAGVGAGLFNPAHMLVIKNLTDTALFGSLDGVTDQMYFAAGEARFFDLTTNKSIGGGYFLAQGDRFYVRDTGTPATQGAVYLEVMYASEAV